MWLGCASFGIERSSASVYGWRISREQRARRRLLDDLARVHHRDVVGAAGDDAEVVGDEHHRHEALALLRLQQVEDLGLHGHVERGRRLVGEEQLRAAGERDRDHHALAHAARQLVRVLAHAALGLGDPDRREQRDARSRSAYSLVTSRWWRSDSVICLPIFITGFSEVIGSWNTIAICVPQSWRSSSVDASTMLAALEPDAARRGSTFAWAAGP